MERYWNTTVSTPKQTISHDRLLPLSRLLTTKTRPLVYYGQVIGILWFFQLSLHISAIFLWFFIILYQSALDNLLVL